MGNYVPSLYCKTDSSSKPFSINVNLLYVVAMILLPMVPLWLLLIKLLSRRSSLIQSREGNTPICERIIAWSRYKWYDHPRYLIIHDFFACTVLEKPWFGKFLLGLVRWQSQGSQRTDNSNACEGSKLEVKTTMALNAV